MTTNGERKDYLLALLNILREEIDLHRGLLKSSNEETCLIIDGQMDSLIEKTKEIESAVFSLRKVEQKRIALTLKLAEVFDLHEEDLTLSQIIGEVPEPYSSKFSEQFEEITQLIQELRAANQSNAMLIRQSLDYIDFNIKLLSGVDFKNPVYKSEGTKKEENAVSGLLDQRA